MPFDFSKIKPPTEEEMRACSLEWWQVHKNINQLAWNQEIKNCSIPFVTVQLSISFLREIVDALETCDRSIIDPLRDRLADMIGDSMEWDEFFVKLCTRSPKDYLYDDKNFGKPRPLNSVIEAADSILSSLRCHEDICMLCTLPDGYASLIVKPYYSFLAREEWRAFVKDGEVVAISQYYYQEEFEEITEQVANNVSNEIVKLVTDVIVPNINDAAFVADFVCYDSCTLLIELNPFYMSDPCLIKSYSEMDGSIFWKENSEIKKLKYGNC